VVHKVICDMKSCGADITKAPDARFRLLDKEYNFCGTCASHLKSFIKNSLHDGNAPSRMRRLLEEGPPPLYMTSGSSTPIEAEIQALRGVLSHDLGHEAHQMMREARQAIEQDMQAMESDLRALERETTEP